MHCSCILCNQYAFQNNLGWELRRGLFKESSSFLWEKKKNPSNTAGLTNAFCEWLFWLPRAMGEKQECLHRNWKSVDFQALALLLTWLHFFFFLICYPPFEYQPISHFQYSLWLGQFSYRGSILVRLSREAELICVYVCVCIYIYIYIYTHICICMIKEVNPSQDLQAKPAS